MNAGWVFAIGAILTGAAGHLIAASRVASRDTGGFWAQVLDRLVVWLAVPVLLVSCFHTTSLLRSFLPATRPFWLAVPAAGWLAIVGLATWKVPEPEQGRWIAGTLEFSPRRFWVLLFALPFVLAAYATAGPGQDQIYAAHWALVVLFLIALAGVAMSAAPSEVWAGIERGREVKQPVPLSPWPDEMRSRGVGLRHLADWEPSLSPAPARGAAAEWQRRLSAVSPGISGTLCEAVSRLVSWEPRNTDPVAIVLGPDDCGQEEVTALLATELSRRYGETTLVVTARADPALARRFTRWLQKVGGESPVALHDMSAGGEAPRPGSLVLADAETLSESVLDKLRSELQQSNDAGERGRSLGRIGVVVWWHAHEFSGVLAAHVWAVSRRLERLLKSSRRLPGRALIFARRPATQESYDQIETNPHKHFLAFLEHLLPYEWRDPGGKEDSNAFTIGSSFSRRTHLYRLEDESPEAVRRATDASLLTDWPTLPPSSVFVSAATGSAVSESAADAAVRILEIRPNELLSLREILCQGGRSSAAGADQHAAIAKDDNAYSDFLLSRLGKQSSGDSSLHLVSPHGHPGLIERHLLLALREVPETLTGLRASFHWEEAMLRRMLQGLSAEGRLSRVPVRFLDAEGRLQRDARYANQNPGQAAVRSFRIIGRSRPVELRDPNVRDRLLKQVDPERLPIDAYPHRTFESEGRRYRVQPWRSATPARIDCQPAEDGIKTWRFATSRLTVTRRLREPQMLRGLECYPARVTYSEDVTGVLERDGAGVFRTIGIEPVRTSFDTDALILKLDHRFDPGSLLSATAAMRHVLPIHMAMDEDTLDVLPLLSPVLYGLALVDLHPGGIGIVDAIHKNVWLVPMLFDRVAEWLSHAKRQDSVQSLSRSPRVRLLGIDRLDVDGALRLFSSATMQPNVSSRS